MDSDFSISVTADAVDVRYTPSVGEPRAKLFGVVFNIVLILALAAGVSFVSGKQGRPSMWHDLTHASSVLPVVFTIIGFALFLGLFGWQGTRYARAAWPSDETLHCDHQEITISRVPWLDFSNRIWRTYTYPLHQVSAIRFAVIASLKGRSYWGLRFLVPGRRWALPGLEAPEAKTILDGLKALGADVPTDPELDKRIKEYHHDQFGDTSWMDRSWMDRSDKK